jgi:hypothetical protein
MPETVRIFLSANYRDMQAEREFLHTRLFPRIEKWFAVEHGLTVEFLDVGRTYEERFAKLKQVLDAVDRCRPYFLCLIGQRYGEGVERLPADALAAYPWLRQIRKGMSRLHLEIMHALLNDPKRGDMSFFYLRDPRLLELYLKHATGGERAKYKAGSPQEEARRDYVVKAVRAAGRPVREYPWDFRAGAAPGFADLGRLIANDLESAITGTSQPSLGETLFPRTVLQLPVSAAPRSEVRPPAAPVAKKKPILDENVQFTVYRPKVVQPERWYDLLAFAHLSQRPADAPDDEPDPVEEVKRQAAGILGKQAAEYGEVTQDAEAAVPRQRQITFVPELDGITFDPPRATFTWQESVRRVDFRMRASAGSDGKTARGRLTVLLGAIIIGEVPLAIAVNRRHVAAKANEPMEAAPGRRFHKIFASYSHKDLDIVKQVEVLASSVGFVYLRDWKDLRAGQVWQAELMRMIKEADIFQLFWSRHSMTSDFVRREWEYALSLGKPDFVRPTYWEEPMPMSKNPPLPPKHLAALHFCNIRESVVPMGHASDGEVDLGAAVEAAVEASSAVDLGAPSAAADQPATGVGLEKARSDDEAVAEALDEDVEAEAAEGDELADFDADEDVPQGKARKKARAMDEDDEEDELDDDEDEEEEDAEAAEVASARMSHARPRRRHTLLWYMIAFLTLIIANALGLAYLWYFQPEEWRKLMDLF